MCRSHLHDFLTGLPKCEHHVHLEGCLTPSLIFELANRNSIKLPDPKDNPAYSSPESLAERYGHFSNLDDFLGFYFTGMSVLISASDFEDLAWEYFKQANADGVHHAEVFFDPQVHVDRGIAYETVVDGFSAACRRAEKEFGMTTKLILCFVKHLPVDNAHRVYNQALESGHFEAGIVHGIGCSSSEVGPPKDMFREIYSSAKLKGIQLTAHAGEEGDPSYISAALEIGSQRIDHGRRLIEDPQLLEYVVKEEIMLTLCPVSNVRLRGVEKIEEVPIRQFLDAGVRFSINSDDPAYFGGFILHNYCAVEDAFGLSIQEWRTIAENSVRGSWIHEERKLELLQRIDDHVRKHTVLA
ncbi:adenosine deaminase [Paecilomyces variotii No. 5]|uniref:Adenine deaminase n=1 Tax=Byssochlamys spectabilis (strain No. 5 / NBRC 109023) TaxID=1356009 RepID=V5G464_BYSSN|nr:adenosine deaminase [Paecilomyces variotii No. 5]